MKKSISDDFHILPTPELKQAAQDCPLLEGDSEAWIACCSRRFLPLAKRIAGDDSLAEDVQERELLVLLREMIDLLPGTYRQVLKLRLYQGFSNKEISRRLHLSRGNVAVRMNRAITLLKRRIDARARS